ncbi:hypothetical protein MCAMS1_02327 [biofilm metagenome]
MRKIISLCIFVFLLSGCASDPKPVSAVIPPAQAENTANQPPLFESLKVGMPRSEAEQLLGEPSSVTDTATGTTSVWVFGNNSQKALSSESANDSATISQIGNIAATAAGIFIPYAGLATSIGSQVYSLSNSGGDAARQTGAKKNNNTRILTIEFRDGKIYSIQRAKAIDVPIASPGSSN